MALGKAFRAITYSRLIRGGEEVIFEVGDKEIMWRCKECATVNYSMASSPGGLISCGKCGAQLAECEEKG